MHGVDVHFGKSGHGSSDYQRNEDVTRLAELTNVTGPDEPCNVSGEVRPPKVVDDVCPCSEVSMMSSGVMSSGEDCWSLVAVDRYFMMTLWIPPPKATILLEEVFGVAQKCSVCGVGESWRMFGGTEPFMNMAQMVFGSAGSIGLGE